MNDYIKTPSPIRLFGKDFEKTKDVKFADIPLFLRRDIYLLMKNGILPRMKFYFKQKRKKINLYIETPPINMFKVTNEKKIILTRYGRYIIDSIVYLISQYNYLEYQIDNKNITYRFDFSIYLNRLPLTNGLANDFIQWRRNNMA